MEVPSEGPGNLDRGTQVAHSARSSYGYRCDKTPQRKALKAYGDNQFNPFAPTYHESCRVRTAADDAAEQLTKAKRKELAALRELAKVCTKVHGHQKDVDETYQVVDVEVRLLSKE